MNFVHVKGVKKGDVLLFALSTCGWCKKTRKLLEELGVDFNYIYVDLLEGSERKDALKELERWNPQLSFPTLVLNNERSIIGYDKESILGALT
ncbi:MAG: glutaredoxin family protein [Methanobacteriaceae archaeon]